MSLTITGGGLNSPASLAVDASGNVWVANYPGILSAFSPQGTPLSTTGYGIGTLSESYGLAIDPSNNIWVTNEQTPNHSGTTGSISAFLGGTSATAGSLLSGTSYFSDASIDYPRAVAADTNGNILIADYGNSSATIYNSSGQLLQSGVASGAAALPVAITADTAHGLWLANQGDNSVTHVSSSGAVLAHTVCCDGASAIAVDSGGNAWVANYNNSSVSELSSNGAILIDSNSTGGIANNDPNGIAIDAAQNIWVANFRGNYLSELAGNTSTAAPGTALSPSTGYGLDANLILPFGIAPDASGDLWVSNFGGSSIAMFFGLAAPHRLRLDAGLTLPFGLALDSSGDLWVSNFGGSSIVMFFSLAAPTATPILSHRRSLPCSIKPRHPDRSAQRVAERPLHCVRLSQEPHLQGNCSSRGMQES